MGREIFGLFNLGLQAPEAREDLLAHVLAFAEELSYGAEHLRVRLDLLKVRDRRRARQFHRLDAKTVAAGRALLFAELHVSQFGHGALLVLHLGRRVRINGDHLLIEIRPGGGLGHFGLEKSASAHLDVHHVRIVEAEQQILQLDERVALVLDLSVISTKNDQLNPPHYLTRHSRKNEKISNYLGMQSRNASSLLRVS